MIRRFLNLDTLFFVYVVLLGLMFVFIVPPFQKPDEVVHFLTVAEIVHGSDLKVEARYLRMPESYLALKLAHKYEQKFPSKLLRQKDTDREAVEYKNLAVNGTGWVSYFPAILGFMVGNSSDYPVVALWGARLFGLLFFLVAMIWSIKVAGKNYRPIVWVYASLPMVVHQVTCISYDTMQLILAPVIFAHFVRIIGDKKRRFEWVVLALLVGLFLMVKGGYYGLLGLLVVVFFVRVEGFFERYPLLRFIPPQLVLVIVIAVLWGFGNRFGFWRTVPFDLVNPVYQYQLSMDNPVRLVWVVSNSWNEKWDFYFRSFTGYFGWLDYQYNLYTLLWVLGIVVWGLRELIKRNEKPILSIHPLLWLWVVIVGQVVMLMVMFYFNWTDVGAGVIEGIQGRYLLPLLPLLIFGVLEVVLRIGKERTKRMLLGLAMMVVVVNTRKVIYERYYDFSDSFWDREAMAKDLVVAKERKENLEVLSSKEAVIKYFDTSDQDELGGFQMAITRTGDGVKVPYRYRVMDEECRKTLKSGYLDQKKLQVGDIYEQTFESFVTSGRVLCLEIKPAVLDEAGQHFNYVAIDGVVQIKPLFVKRE